jgi:hypothetical protein
MISNIFKLIVFLAIPTIIRPLSIIKPLAIDLGKQLEIPCNHLNIENTNNKCVPIKLVSNCWYDFDLKDNKYLCAIILYESANMKVREFNILNLLIYWEDVLYYNKTNWSEVSVELYDINSEIILKQSKQKFKCEKKIYDCKYFNINSNSGPLYIIISSEFAFKSSGRLKINFDNSRFLDTKYIPTMQDDYLTAKIKDISLLIGIVIIMLILSITFNISYVCFDKLQRCIIE